MPQRKREKRPHPTSRMVHYDLPIDFTPTREAILEKAKANGVVYDFDGSTGIVWFNAPPGIETRALKKELLES